MFFFDPEEENRTIVGEYGKYLIGPQAERVVKSAKIKMGTSYKYKIDSNSYTAPYISTRILMQLKGSAEQTLFRNIPFPDDVVIAVPASFEKKMRVATRKAAQRAGFKNVILVDEPIAVLYDFYNRLHNGDVPAERYNLQVSKILVFDLGGGTLDVSLHSVSYKSKEQDSYDLNIYTMAKSRFTKIGGNNFDRKLADFLQETYLGDLPSDLKLSEEEKRYLKINFQLYAEEAKIDLNNRIQRWKLFREDELDSKSIHTKIRRMPYKNQPFNYDLSLSKYEECVKTFLAHHQEWEAVDQFDSESDPEDIIDPILDVLKKAQTELKSSEIPKPDIILLNGSMSKLHTIQKRLKVFFGFPPDDVGDLDLAVARGAAVYAAKNKRKVAS